MPSPTVIQDDEGDLVVYPESVLADAIAMHRQYGNIPSLFHSVADRWSIILGVDVAGWQVAACLASLENEKLKRSKLRGLAGREARSRASLANFLRDVMTGLSEYPA